MLNTKLGKCVAIQAHLGYKLRGVSNIRMAHLDETFKWQEKNKYTNKFSLVDESSHSVP